jgi:DNA-binding CsgD family transcriptional regulator
MSESPRTEGLLRRLQIPQDLSAREIQVALRGARGLDTKTTAVELGLSPKTVDTLWRRIYRKLNCRSRSEVLSRLLAESLIQSNPFMAAS